MVQSSAYTLLQRLKFVWNCDLRSVFHFAEETEDCQGLDHCTTDNINWKLVWESIFFLELHGAEYVCNTISVKMS